MTSTFVLSWVGIGTLVMLIHILFFVDIDSRWADHFFGYPLVYAFTIIFWPITALWMIGKSLPKRRGTSSGRSSK